MLRRSSEACSTTRQFRVFPSILPDLSLAELVWHRGLCLFRTDYTGLS
jgi:hypothetical protein